MSVVLQHTHNKAILMQGNWEHSREEKEKEARPRSPGLGLSASHSGLPNVPTNASPDISTSWRSTGRIHDTKRTPSKESKKKVSTRYIKALF